MPPPAVVESSHYISYRGTARVVIKTNKTPRNDQFIGNSFMCTVSAYLSIYLGSAVAENIRESATGNSTLVTIATNIRGFNYFINTRRMHRIIIFFVSILHSTL